MTRRLGYAAALAVALAVLGGAAPEPPRPAIVRGTVVAFTPAPPAVVRDAVTTIGPAELTVRVADGSTVTVLLAAGSRVAVVAKAGLEALQPGGIIGTVTRPRRGGVVEATEVHLIPDAVRSLGGVWSDGRSEWDRGRGSMLATGTVTHVGTIKHHAGRTLTLDYKGGSEEVVVPANAAIVALADGSQSSLTVGTRVVATTQHTADGRLAAGQIAVGAGGVVPPM